MAALGYGHAIWRALRRLGPRLSNPPVFAGWSAARTSPSAAAVHRWTRGENLRRRGALARALLPLELALWYASLVPAVLLNTLLHGPTIRARTGRGLARQARDQLALGLAHSIPARSYYLFRLYEDGPRARAGDYLHRYETKRGVYRGLRRHVGGEAREMNDKLAFQRRCGALGIRTPAVLMEFRGGRAVAISAQTLPGCDLIAKPRKGRGGREVVRWSYLGGGRYESSAGTVLARERLVEQLARQARLRSLLVQPRLKPHADLADLAGEVLITVRIVTCRDERGGAEATNASLRIAVGHSVVDNMHRGGIAARVDMLTGRVGRAMGCGATSDWMVKHPTSGAPIAGRILPHWREAVELARRAHRAFAGIVVAGWDVALLDDGPCIVEGNASPCVNLIQRPLGAPVGDGRLGRLMAHHIDAIERGTATRIR